MITLYDAAWRPVKQILLMGIPEFAAGKPSLCSDHFTFVVQALNVK